MSVTANPTIYCLTGYREINGECYWWVDRGFGIVAKFYGPDGEKNRDLFVEALFARKENV